ncbi:MAG: D-aminoacyl-tRNA deacylase [Defluviitaleaceae bacterium]|nr:D-aminoacyl-tRNA deacylase [Defluviitaleaceae bacterium]
MRCIIQRVSRAKVSVDNKVIGEIEKGIMVLVGVAESDDEKTFDYMAGKLIHLRIFPDENDKMNLSTEDIGGGILLVPNFTLYGDAHKGRRPSYIAGAPPNIAADIFGSFVEYVKNQFDGKVDCGEFGAHMDVELINDGPVTILLDSDKTF